MIVLGDIVLFSRFNRPPTIPHPVGDGTEPIYEEVLDPDIGHKVLKEVGRHNLVEFVQASLPETLVYNILARFERGDVDVLNRTEGVFADVVGMPTNLAEAKASIIKFESMFENLSAEDKAKFNNNVNEFLQAVATAQFDNGAPVVETTDDKESDVDNA